MQFCQRLSSPLCDTYPHPAEAKLFVKQSVENTIQSMSGQLYVALNMIRTPNPCSIFFFFTSLRSMGSPQIWAMLCHHTTLEFTLYIANSTRLGRTFGGFK